MKWYGFSCNGNSGRLALVSVLLQVSSASSWAESVEGNWGVDGQVLHERQLSSSTNDSMVLLQLRYMLERPPGKQVEASYIEQPWPDAGSAWRSITTPYRHSMLNKEQAWPDAGIAWRSITGTPDSVKALKVMGAHPFWHLELHRLRDVNIIPCCAVMAIAGILCSAGGIGGGGIYVSVLMVVGGLQLVDAVPLSQAIIFIGSIPTMFMNLRKGRESTQRLIDYDLCRVVVPLSLSGTFLGVILNRHLPGWLTLSVLTGVLILMTVTMVCETKHQYANECKTLDMLTDANTEVSSHGGSTSPSRQSSDGAMNSARGSSAMQRQVSDPASRELTWCDFGVLVLMLALVIAAGVLRFHSSRCARSPKDLRNKYCNHRALFWLPFGTMEQLVFTESFATEISVMAMVVPLMVCSSVGLSYATLLVKQSTWKFSGVATYSSMALGTGILSGLLGIGGGLIFSPFFLLMGQRPAVAVATSSTCVLISSSSAALQYLLTDRVVMSLAFLYGAVNLLSSFTGTTLVHWLQDHMGTSKSLISGIVAFGVLLSTMLTMMKLWSQLQTHFGP